MFLESSAFKTRNSSDETQERPVRPQTVGMAVKLDTSRYHNVSGFQSLLYRHMFIHHD